MYPTQRSVNNFGFLNNVLDGRMLIISGQMRDTICGYVIFTVVETSSIEINLVVSLWISLQDLGFTPQPAVSP